MGGCEGGKTLDMDLTFGIIWKLSIQNIVVVLFLFLQSRTDRAGLKAAQFPELAYNNVNVNVKEHLAMQKLLSSLEIEILIFWL